MLFNAHSSLRGKHAFLGASKHSWLNYDDEKMTRVFFASMAAQRGTELHAFAKEAIRLGVRLPSSRKTLNLYVNDAIGYRMHPEQILFYSDNCFGTADTIGFRRNVLRIHDLKTGLIEASMNQLEIYAALFCLEYGIRPFEIEIELRVYQNDEIRVHRPDADEIMHIMDKIITFDKLINNLRLEVD